MAWGIRKTLKKIKDLYGDVPIYITENGFPDYEGIEDYQRMNYYLVSPHNLKIVMALSNTYLLGILKCLFRSNT